MANQIGLAKACLAFDGLHGHFPGYLNRVGKDENGQAVDGSWIVAVLPFCEQEDLAKEWEAGVRTAPRLGWLICPNGKFEGSRPEDPVLSYVANCGLPGDQDTAADGIFHNLTLPKPVGVSLDYVKQHDGTERTLLLSENLQAGFWNDASEADLGMVWHRKPADCNLINHCRDAGFRPQDIQYARPASYHPGGVVAAYCDGQAKFVSEQIDYGIFQHLMTPDSREAGL